VFCGCEAVEVDAPLEIPGRWQMPPLSELEAPITPEDAVVAEGPGWRVLASEVQSHLAREPGRSPLEVAEKLVELELLALEGERRGMATDPVVMREVRQVAVRELVYGEMVEKHGPEKIRQEDYRRAYEHPSVRLRFDHVDGYRAVDAQLVCCVGDWKQCAKDDETTACLDGYEATAKGVEEALRARGPFASPEAYKSEIQRLAMGLPALKINDLDFWFKVGVPYESQKGYTRYHKNLVEEVRQLTPGQVGRAVRTPHAWHIPVLFQHIPEVHKDHNDPEVRAEIAKNIYPLIQARDFSELLERLEKVAKPEYRWDVLVRLDPEQTPVVQESE
jgi:hypothetical protein